MCGRKNISKIQVEGEHDSVLPQCFLDDLCIGELNETFVAQMDRVVTGSAQCLHGS